MGKVERAGGIFVREKEVSRGLFSLTIYLFDFSLVMSVVVSTFLSESFRSFCLNTWKPAHRILKGILLNVKSAGHDCSPISH